ncbi:hypothetical protein SRABI26_03485 [Arthrobacter sp. Bi26]|nr:hypothetical protein SRABI26_03485 [Arthrobacter sp. Bi26]
MPDRNVGPTTGFCAIRAFLRRRGRPEGAKKPSMTKPSMTKSSVGRTAEQERHPLRYGDKIPDAHFWWF